MDLLNLINKTFKEENYCNDSNCDCHKYKDDYFAYHLHTKYSIKDGISPIDKLVEKANELKHTRVIPTDHGNIASIYDIFKECDKYPNLKAGIGCEFYIVHSADKPTQSQPHITTIVENNKGWENMLKLQYLSAIKEGEGEIDGFQGSYGYKQHITEKHLFHFQEGLIVGSGCRLSLPNREFLKGNHEKGLLYLDMFRSNLKKFFIELHVAESDGEEKLFWILNKYAQEYNLPTIIANDSHYVDEGQLVDWQLISSLRDQKNITTTKHRIKNDDFYMKSYDQIFIDTRRCFNKGLSKEYLPLFIESLTSINPIIIPQWGLIIAPLITLLIEMLNNNKIFQYNDSEVGELFKGFNIMNQDITFDWFGSWDKRKLPKLHYEGAEQELKQTLWNNLKVMFNGNPPQKYIDRLKEEFLICKETDNISYFHLVGVKYLQKCKEKGLMMSEGRGSASSLLLSKLLDCARVDPLEFDLIIDRAMNRDRKKLMDIDLDFASTESKEAKEILFEIVGRNNAVAIGNYSYYGVKKTIQDVGRFFKIPPKLMDEVTKSKELNFKEDIEIDEEGEEQVTISKAQKEEMLEKFKNHSFIQNLNNNPIEHIFLNEETNQEERITVDGDLFYEYVLKLYDSISNLSVHASGILVFNEPIWKYVPITRINDTLISQWDMSILEELNGLKLDVLKIKSNDLVKRGLNYLNKYNLLIRNYDDEIKALQMK